MQATATPNQGRFMDLAVEVVNQQGVIFISSAGNAGPALSTAGAPGGTGSPIISIGAYVSQDMATAAHSVRWVGELVANSTVRMGAKPCFLP